LSLNEKSSGVISAPSLPEVFSSWHGMDRLQSACLGIVLLDIEAVSPAGEYLFTPREAARAMKMGPRRLKSFTASRIALKRLVCQLDLVEKDQPDREIETLRPDEVRPCLADSGLYCSVSHSGCLVIAVAHRYPIGVDLEMISEKVLKTSRLFMSSGERGLMSFSGMSPERAATRIWTSKEAAAKLWRLQLFQAFHEVEVVRMGEEEGMMRFQKKEYPVRHAEGNGYVITLISDEEPQEGV
jgi:4'-phosphopantetheinyl transferase EntD